MYTCSMHVVVGRPELDNISSVAGKQVGSVVVVGKATA
jgi:hypothetical protein